ncbi:unnamed protein product [Cylicostephanus goldi]|uniref:Uncharacterized protein n=1 Tax=Cylicostephanus goldi TaxID=71465 RepID=A0A3P7M625_CYLGO|nr:unnamed protein product [Cylicostephanus goldi]
MVRKCFVKGQLHRDGLVEVVSCFGHCGHPHPLPTSTENEVSRDHELANTNASGAYTLDPSTSSYESSSQTCSNDDFDIDEEEDVEHEGEGEDEVIIVDDVPQPVPSQDTVAKEKTLEAYRRFEQKLLQVGELMQMFVEDQRYDLMNKFNDMLELVMQQVPPDLINRTNFGKQLNAQSENS